MWASQNEINESTTNACESFHSHFGKNFYNHSPHIFIFLNEIKELQEEVFILMRSNEPRNDYSAAMIQKQASFQLNLLNYQRGHISRFKLVKILSNYYKN